MMMNSQVASRVSRSQTAEYSPHLRNPAPSFAESPGAGTAEALFSAYEMLPDGVALLDPAGSVLFVNRSFAQMAPALVQPRAITALCHPHTLPRRPAADKEDAPSLRAHPVPLQDDRYRLRATWVDLEHFGLGHAVLVLLQASPDFPEAELLRQRFRLTEREIEVARLLARGRSNKGIAATLGISLRTASCHTERVFTKLGVRSRAQVGPLLRSLGNGAGADDARRGRNS